MNTAGCIYKRYTARDGNDIPRNRKYVQNSYRQSSKFEIVFAASIKQITASY